MNTYESQKLEEFLVGGGFNKVDNLSSADLVIINSCSVRQAAEDSVYGLGKQFKALGSKKPTVILTGCVTGAAKTSRRRYEIAYLQKKAPFVDLFLTSEEIIEYLPNLLLSDCSQYASSTPAGEAADGVLPHTTAQLVTKAGFVPISYGCDNFCSYCIVPYARGPERSRPFEEIRQEVADLISKGVTEIMLLGQNVNSWSGGTTPTKFSELLKIVHDLPDLTKLSFMTSNPWDFSDDLIETLKLPKIDRYLHLPVQSGDNEVLQRMNRHYTAEQYFDLVGKIKKAVPEIILGTDIIVGFPGETDAQFENTLKLIKEVGFKKIYAAMYSPRKGTVSAETMEDNIHKSTKRLRHKKVLELTK